jgi:hypothetical protein
MCGRYDGLAQSEPRLRAMSNDKRLLEEHGTDLMVLRPSSIWSAAVEDLKRREHNTKAELAELKHYAFHRDHVRKAETANDVIRNAIAGIEKGRLSGKYNTRLLYRDPELLKQALQ